MAIKGNISKVEWDAAGNEFAAAIDLGDIKDDSTHDPALLEDNKNTKGEVIWAGEDNSYTINVFDTSKRADLMTKWKAGENIDVKLTWSDDSTESVLDVRPKVGPVVNPVKPGERAMFALTVYKYVTS